jgi:hypothetical protein
MTPLAAKLVFLTSSALGTAALGSTAYLVEHPRAFSPEPVRPLAIAPIAPRPLPPEPVLVPEPVALPAVVVTGTKAPLIPKARPATKPAKEKAFVPCTEWRDMGPTNTNKGNTQGMRRVRTLC